MDLAGIGPVGFPWSCHWRFKMDVSLKREGYTLQLRLTEYELESLLAGIGATSENDRMRIGMSREQSCVVGDLYFHISNAVEKLS